MTDREKVINDLQDAVNDDWMWQHADYYAKAMENALALLKEQEPKLLTLRDLLDDCKAAYEVVWLEMTNGTITPHQVYSNGPDSPYAHIMSFGGSTYALRKDEYGKTWRCWSQKPTVDQMDQTAWEAETDG